MTVPGCQVPPKAGEAFFLEGRAEPAARRFRSERNWRHAAGWFLKYCAVGTDIRGGGTLVVGDSAWAGDAACTSVWACPVTEAPSSSESANAAVAAVANERQTRCNVFEAAAEVEEAEGEHKLAKDSIVSKRADGVAMSEISLNFFLDGTL